MVANEPESARLEQRSVIKFLLAEKSKAWKIYIYETEMIRQSMEWKHQVQLSVKKVMLTFFWDIKGLITIDFLEKGAARN